MIRNERGSLLVTIMIGVAVLLLVLGLLNWLNVNNQLVVYSRQKVQIDNATKQLLSAVETCLTNLRTTGPNANQCPRQSEFVALMNLPTTSPVPVILNWNDITTTPGFLNASALTLITTSLANTTTVEITRDVASYYDAGTMTYQSVDAMNGSTHLNMKVKASPAGGFFSFNTSNISRSYRVTVESPAGFALYLRDGTNPRIDLQGGSRLTVYGKTLIWENGAFTPTDLINSSQINGLNLDQVFAHATSVSLPALGGADQIVFDKLRNIGFQVNWLTNAVDPFQNPRLPKWQQRLDYSFVMKTNGYPLPVFNNEVTGHGEADLVRTLTWNVPADTARANVTTFPDPLVFGALGLEYTCTRPNNFNLGSIKALVLNRANDNLTLDYTLVPATYGCGQIAAKKITVIVPSGSTVAWFGNLIAEQLIVQGGGELTIINPFGYAQMPSGIPSPPNLDTSEMMQMFMALDSSTGHNFFVPFADPGNSIPSSIDYSIIDYESPCAAPATPTDKKFCPCSTSTTMLCWKPTIPPPDLTILFPTSCNGSGAIAGSCWSENLYFLAEEEN